MSRKKSAFDCRAVPMRHCAAMPSLVNACETQRVSRLVAGLADGYLARLNNCRLTQPLNSPTRSPLRSPLINKQGTGIIFREIFFATSFSLRRGPTLNCDHFALRSRLKKNFRFHNVTREKGYVTWNSPRRVLRMTFSVRECE